MRNEIISYNKVNKIYWNKKKLNLSKSNGWDLSSRMMPQRVCQESREDL